MGLDTLDETKPFDTDPVSLGDDAIRETRASTKQSFGLEHWLSGEHKIMIGAPAARPTTGKPGRLFINSLSNVIEYDNGSAWVASGPGGVAGSSIYQRVTAGVAANLNFGTTETGLVTFPTITTRGGVVRIYGMWNAYVSVASGMMGWVYVRVYCDATVFANVQLYVEAGTNVAVPLPTPSCHHLPTAGVHGYSIKAYTQAITQAPAVRTPPAAGTPAPSNGTFFLEEAA
jgi:hypothetical protein